jgi:hypothetical protein
MWLIVLNEGDVQSFWRLHQRSAFIPGVLACVHMYMLYVCAYVCVCMYVYRRACMYVYACACVYVFKYMYIHMYM